MHRLIVLAFAVVVLTTTPAFAAPVRTGAFENPYIPEKTIWRMQQVYGLPLALPEWLPKGYRFKGFSGFKHHSISVVYAKGGKLPRVVMFQLVNDYTACTARQWVRRQRVPGVKGAGIGCSPGAGRIFAWSQDEGWLVIRRVLRETRHPWRETGA